MEDNSTGWKTRAEELLPVRYSHVAFKVPQPLAALAFQDQRVFYRLLFRALVLRQLGAYGADRTLFAIGRP